MISLQDLVTLAKAGWTPKQTKEILEMIETSPKVQEAEPKDLKPEVEIKPEEPKEEPKVEDQPSTEDDTLEALKKLLTEE